MKASLKWLKELIPALPLGETPEDMRESAMKIADILTMTGSEMEEMIYWGDRIKDVIVVNIEKVEKDTPRKGLSRCIVTDGENSWETLSGAPFIEEGIQAAFVKPGGRIATGDEIGEMKIEGMKSQGMLLSGVELGFEEPADRLFPIPDGTHTGAEMLDLLGWKDEWVIDMEVTPNRPDLFGHLGLARDLASALELELTDRPATIPEEAFGDVRNVEIDIKYPEGCPRYSGLVIENIKTGASPLWLQGRLRVLGIRPISNVVDVTNYVLMYLPHPMHAFDLDKTGNRIIVEKGGGEFTTLDGEKRKILDTDVVISTPNGPVAIGGIMGGLDSEVTENTENILLEAAYFDPPHIRRTSRRLKLFSESSHRFERGMDPGRTERALLEAANLIYTLAGGVVGKRIVDAFPGQCESHRIDLDPALVERVLGKKIPNDIIVDILERLAFTPVYTGSDKLAFYIPTFRPDIERPIDLVEEVGRIYGYDNIDPNTQNKGDLPADIDPIWKWRQRLHEFIRGLGFMPILGSPIDSGRRLKPFGDNLVEIRNPMSEDYTHLRPSLLAALVDSASYNRRQQFDSVSLFEIDKVYFEVNGIPDEEYRIAAVMTGNREDKLWHNTKPTPFDIFDLKGLIEDISGYTGVELSLKARDIAPFMPSNSFEVILDGKAIGRGGRLEPSVAKLFDLKHPVFALEMSLEAIVDAIEFVDDFAIWSRFPASSRDIALILDEDIPAGDVISEVPELDILEDVRIFDLYSGKPIPKGKKSLGIAFRYRGQEGTLTDEDIEKAHNPIVEKLLKKFNAEIREG